MKFAGVVILYHPTFETFENIKSYIDDLDILYIIDNTEKEKYRESLPIELQNNDKIVYMKLGENTGIAHPLNLVIEKLDEHDFPFLLTMDQDSYFLPGVLEKYKNEVLNCELSQKKVAMYALNYWDTTEPIENKKIQSVKLAITSGSIVVTKIAKKIQGFNEKLFIDEVDHDYCCKAIENGYKILLLNNIHMVHSLGSPIKKYILGKTFCSDNHSALRKYYIFRNGFYIMERYPWIERHYYRRVIKSLLNVILLESNKVKKIKMILRGLYDGRCKHFGRYNG
jgi:rhamnosyltransferase